MKIGLMVPLAEDEWEHAESWASLRARAEEAEAAGLDSVWVYDHLLHRFEGKPVVGFQESWTVLSALAAATSRVELGTTVLCAGFRNPALLARMAVTLDAVSGGRLILGLGAGWHEPEFDAFGFPFDHRVSRFAEALQIIRPLLRTGEVDVEGTYHRAKECVLQPRGPRTDIPLLIASFGPRMMRLTARYADLWNTDWLGPAAHLAERRAALDAACAAEGRDPATLGITGGVTIGYPDLGPLPGWMRADPSSYFTGPADAVGARLAEYAALGVQHVIANVYPFTEEAVARFAAAATASREMVASGTHA